MPQFGKQKQEEKAIPLQLFQELAGCMFQDLGSDKKLSEPQKHLFARIDLEQEFYSVDCELKGTKHLKSILILSCYLGEE